MRNEIIAEMADDITVGITRCVSMTDIIDWMMDDTTIDPALIAGLVSTNEDIRIDCRYRLLNIVRREAVNFFNTNNIGIIYIDDELAERKAEEDEDAKERMKT